MAMGKAWTLAKPFQGPPKLSDFKLVDEKVPLSLKDDEIWVEALYLSVDPYMRRAPVKPGGVMAGEQVAKVKQSKNVKYPRGTLVQFHHGWRTEAVISPRMDRPDSFLGKLMLMKVPDLGGLSPSLALGVLGMPGMTAYFGMDGPLREPQPGELVMVSGAAGAVGSIAGQIAKIKGAKVIGSGGSEEKCEMLRSLGFDFVFNYKTTTVDEALKKFAPDGVDLYFDTVGGDFSWALYSHVKFNGRVTICGEMSTMNDSPGAGRNLFPFMVKNRVTFQGIFGWHFFDRFHEAAAVMLKWIKEGKLQYRETMTEGFENMASAFVDLFQGNRSGKAIVKV